MRAKKIAALAAAAVVAVGGALTYSTVTASAASGFTDTVSISNHEDSGNNGNWALDTLKRTTTITDNGNGTYKAVISDKGTFEASNSPITGDTIPDGHATGTMAGTWTFTVTSNATPTVPADDGPYNDNTAHKAPATGDWVARYFPAGTDVQDNSDWSWTYSNACQSWTDSVTDTHIGDISMVCDSAHAFSLSNVCRVPSSTQYVFLVRNNTDKAQKFHAGIQYGGTIHWFGYADRQPLAAGHQNGLVSPHTGKLVIQLSTPDHGANAELVDVYSQVCS